MQGGVYSETYLLGTPVEGDSGQDHTLCWLAQVGESPVIAGEFVLYGPENPGRVPRCPLGRPCIVHLTEYAPEPSPPACNVTVTLCNQGEGLHHSFQGLFVHGG